MDKYYRCLLASVSIWVHCHFGVSTCSIAEPSLTDKAFLMRRVCYVPRGYVPVWSWTFLSLGFVQRGHVSEEELS